MNTGRCVTCRFWERLVEGEHLGLCSSEKFVESDLDDCPIDGLEYWDYESNSAGFNTGEQFGCIHWKLK